jgi:hypothetical protein
MGNALELEFDCEDCGLHVVSIGPRHNPAMRCAGCQWLTEITVPPDERASLRQHMLERGIIGTGEEDGRE